MSTVTIPAHLLQTGDRLNLHGYWHTAGRVTLENYDTGSEVHIVLDNGASDTRIGAHERVQIALDPHDASDGETD